jgi:hypothetical protein
MLEIESGEGWELRKLHNGGQSDSSRSSTSGVALKAVNYALCIMFVDIHNVVGVLSSNLCRHLDWIEITYAMGVR